MFIVTLQTIWLGGLKYLEKKIISCLVSSLGTFSWWIYAPHIKLLVEDCLGTYWDLEARSCSCWVMVEKSRYLIKRKKWELFNVWNIVQIVITYWKQRISFLTWPLNWHDADFSITLHILFHISWKLLLKFSSSNLSCLT